MSAKLKYGMRLGSQIVPAGTLVTLLDRENVAVQRILPGVEYKSNAVAVAVQFEGRDHATLVHYKELVIEDTEQGVQAPC